MVQQTASPGVNAYLAYMGQANEQEQTRNEASRIKVQQNEENNRQYRWEEENKLNQVEKQLNLRIKKNALEKEEYENKLLQNMQSGSEAANGQEDQANSNQALAAKNRKMGQAMNQVDPAKAKKYFDLADSYESAATNRIKTSLEIKSKQVDQAGQLLANIGSQEDLNSALPDLFSAGLSVPAEMRNWNDPKTRDWITKQALRSPTVAKDLQDQIGFLKDKDALQVDKSRNAVIDENSYNKSLRERASQISASSTEAASGRGREGRYSETVAIAGNEVIGSLSNLVTMPLNVSTGIFGSASHTTSDIMSAPVSALKNQLTTSDVQRYKTEIGNVGRYYAKLLSGGLQQPESASREFQEQFAVREGDSESTRLTKLAQMRQTFERVAEVKLKSKATPEEQKELWHKWLGQVKELVPITVADINKIESSKDPKKLIKDILEESKGKVDSPIDTLRKERASKFKVIRE